MPSVCPPPLPRSPRREHVSAEPPPLPPHAPSRDVVTVAPLPDEGAGGTGYPRKGVGWPGMSPGTSRPQGADEILEIPPPRPLVSGQADLIPSLLESRSIFRRLAGTGTSLVIHVILLLVLALSIAPHDASRPVAIVIDTAPAEAALEFDEPPLELPTDEPWDEPADSLPEFPDLADQPDIDLTAAIAEPQLSAELPVDFSAELASDGLLTQIVGAPADPARNPMPGGGREGLAAGAGGPAGHGQAGFGGEVGRRLAMAGARTGDVQVTLAWNNLNDIDLHVISPIGERIFFGYRLGRCGGCLDVDMNVVPTTRAAVENVFWPHGHAPRGIYTVFVHHFRRHASSARTPFEVHVLVRGRKEVFRGVVSAGQAPVMVARFDLDGRGLPEHGPSDGSAGGAEN
jgi:hypothetical protein